MPLTDVAIRNAKPRDKPYKVGDTLGLFPNCGFGFDASAALSLALKDIRPERSLWQAGL
jgi:hypothetical protein